MSRYAPVNFPDVKLEGKFWHERLETVLTRSFFETLSEPLSRRCLGADGAVMAGRAVVAPVLGGGCSGNGGLTEIVVSSDSIAAAAPGPIQDVAVEQAPFDR